MLGYTDCESLSRRSSRPFDGELLLGDAGSCLGAARRWGISSGRTPAGRFQHLHLHSSSVFRGGWKSARCYAFKSTFGTFFPVSLTNIAAK